MTFSTVSVRCVAGTADGSVWAWNVRDGTLRWGGVDHEPHPALAKLPRRRRRDRNPFAAFIGRNDPGGYEAKQVRFLVAPPTPLDPLFELELPHQRQLVVGSVGGHAVFQVWDAGTGLCPDKGIGPCGWARDADWIKDDSLCHVAHSRCGFLLYTTAVDAKEVRAWSVYGSFGGDAATCAWRSDRLAVRGLRLAGLVALPRTGGAGGELVATCCAPMVDGAGLANVPAKEVRAAGADVVLAVNVVGASRVPRRSRLTSYSPPRAPGESGSTIGGDKREELDSSLRARMAALSTSASLPEPPLSRVTHALVTALLSIWKAGGDQARLHADALVDLRVEGVPLAATWRSRAVADACFAQLEGAGVGEELHRLWRAGGCGDRETFEWKQVVDPWPEAHKAPADDEG